MWIALLTALSIKGSSQPSWIQSAFSEAHMSLEGLDNCSSSIQIHRLLPPSLQCCWMWTKWHHSLNTTGGTSKWNLKFAHISFCCKCITVVCDGCLWRVQSDPNATAAPRPHHEIYQDTQVSTIQFNNSSLLSSFVRLNAVAMQSLSTVQFRKWFGKCCGLICSMQRTQESAFLKKQCRHLQYFLWIPNGWNVRLWANGARSTWQDRKQFSIFWKQWIPGISDHLGISLAFHGHES